MPAWVVTLGIVAVIALGGGATLQRTGWSGPVWWVSRRVIPFLAKWLLISALPLALTGIVGPLLDGSTVSLDSVIGKGLLLWPVVGLSGGVLWTLLTKHGVVQPADMVPGLGAPAIGVLVTSTWLVGHINVISPQALPFFVALSIGLLASALLLGGGTAVVSQP